MLTIQYLEGTNSSGRKAIPTVLEKLRMAADILPISHLLIGWQVPEKLLEACRKEVQVLGIRFLRWHPTLVSDGTLIPSNEMRVIGLDGNLVEGHRSMSGFDFICPNNPNVRERVLERLENLIRMGLYEGFFLDRLRFPSPARNPVKKLGCCCSHCRKKAGNEGIDLQAVRDKVIALETTRDGRLMLVRSLLGDVKNKEEEQISSLLGAFLAFRERSISELIQLAAFQIKNHGLELGLDFYSPGLARMVGQNLASLEKSVDWVKLMSYAHVNAPAGIPFELAGLHDFVRKGTFFQDRRIMKELSSLFGVALPESRELLMKVGLSSDSLQKEVERGVRDCPIPVLAGIELIRRRGITTLTTSQITADLEAIQHTGIAGLSLSWDLWDMPVKYLKMAAHRLP